MPTHSVSLLAVSVHPPRKRDALVDVTNIGGSGFGVLEVFRSVMEKYRTINLQDSDLIDTVTRVFVTVEAVLQMGYWVQATFDAGHYGQPGRVRRVVDGFVEHEHEGDRSATSTVRVMGMAAPQSTAALFVCEKVGMKSSAGIVKKPLNNALKAIWPDQVIQIDTVTETDAWLEAARVEQLKATYFGWSSDLADAGAQEAAGELVAVIKPISGLNLWSRLRRREITAGQLLGLSNRPEPDETRVQVSRDGRTKTFALGRESTPSITEVISDGAPPPSDHEFRLAAIDQYKQHGLRITGQNWQGIYEHGQWSPSRMSLTPGGGA